MITKMEHHVCLLAILQLCLSGCASSTAYKPAGAEGGYSETLYAPDIFCVHFDGNENTPVGYSRDFALLRAADLTIQNGYLYFTVSDVTPLPSNFPPPQISSSPNVQVNNYNYGNTYNYRNQTMQWNDDNGMASQNARTGLSGLGNFLTSQQAAKKQARQLSQTDLLVHCFVGKPQGIEAFNATFVGNSLRQKYGIKEALPLNEASQTARSQTKPLSGHYIGTGKSVSSGIEQPYHIAIDVFDSGEITFACTAIENNQQVVVSGKGTLDSNGEVTVQNQFGDIGHGNISGRVFKAGGKTLTVPLVPISRLKSKNRHSHH